MNSPERVYHNISRAKVSKQAVISVYFVPVSLFSFLHLDLIMVKKVVKSELNTGGKTIMVSALTYHHKGDYLIPDLIPPESPNIGIWGLRRMCFLQKDHDGIYTGMLLSGKLNAHLEEIDRSANEMFDLLAKQYAAREGVTEELKANNQMEWVRRMNGIRKRTEEIIYSELIYR